MDRPHVLILGGGYAATKAVKRLRGAMKRNEVDVTVVTRHNYHELHGLIGEMVTGRLSVEQILSPVRRVFAPARVHVGEIESIDLAGRRVVVSRHLDGARHTLTYNHLVIALGTTDNLELYPGLAEHGFRLKMFDDCFRVKNHILTMFELADIEDDPTERSRLLTFFVAGGGFAGCEVAGELCDFARLLTACEYKRIQPEEWRVVLVQPGPHILPELHTGSGAAGYGHGHPRLVAYATRHLEDLGAEIVLNCGVSWVSATEVGLSDGRRIPTRTVISAVGTRPHPVIEALPVEKDSRGRVVVDSYLRVRGQADVWAAGDCAAVPHPNGGTCPPTALWALKEGIHLGKNLVSAVAGSEPSPFSFRGLYQMVSIGRRCAVGEVKGIELKGKLPWLAWRMGLLAFVPTWDRRVKLVSDWLVWPVVGRDVVEMSVTDANRYDINTELFEPDEVIMVQGKVCPFVYVIVEGQAESAHQETDGKIEIRQLGPGDHFGRRARDGEAQDTVIAKTVLRAVSVRADHGQRLDLLATIGQSTDPDPVG